MDKRRYFFILYVLSFGYLTNCFTSSVITLDASLVLTMLWGGWGWLVYSKKNKHHSLPGINSITIVITLCLLISPLVPLYYYSQPYLSTMISQRFNFAIFLLPIIAVIRPTEKELFEPMRICSFITMVFFIWSIFMPGFFVDNDNAERFLNSKAMGETTDIGTIVPGIPLAAFYFFYKFSTLVRKHTIHDIVECMSLLALLIAYQNRSTLIGIAPLVLYVLYKLLKTSKGYTSIIIIGIVLVAIPVLSIIWQSLAQETEEQMADENYPRLLAIQYYVFEAKDNLIKILFGNGVWTGKGLYTKVIESWPSNIYVSDIGIIGTFFYYGILPLFILYKSVLYTLFAKKMPVYLRGYSLWILLVPTIHTFLVLFVPSNLIFSLYFYLVSYKRYDYSKRIISKYIS